METRDWRNLRMGIAMCSYRTYEEWKRVLGMIPGADVFGSYRTYEEWKPASDN